MANYFLPSRNPIGRTVTEIVEADSAIAAVDVLQQRGCTNIVLHTDDIDAKTALPLPENKFLSPREQIELRQRGDFGCVIWLTLKYYGILWKCQAIVILSILMVRTLDAPRRTYDFLCLAVLLVPPALSLIFFVSGWSTRVHALAKAASWGRWQQVLRLLPRVRGRLPLYVVAWLEAQALAELGRIEEALRLLEPFSGGREIPEWFYWSLMSTVYRAAGQTDLAFTAQEKASDFASDSPLAFIGFANSLLVLRRDRQRAEELLKRAVQCPISDQVAPAFFTAEGLLAIGQEKGTQLVFENELRPIFFIFFNFLFCSLAARHGAHCEFRDLPQRFAHRAKRSKYQLPGLLQRGAAGD